jgi:hypothetical protein
MVDIGSNEDHPSIMTFDMVTHFSSDCLFSRISASYPQTIAKRWIV